MNEEIRWELLRLTSNAAGRREELLSSGIRKSRRRKLLNIVAGVLSLLSAGAITAVLANIVGKNGVQVVAALIAMISGTISLVVTSYFSDDEIINLFNGSSKYLGLRESVNRLAVNPKMSYSEKFEGLGALQEAYAKLDESYSRYFSTTAKSSGLLQFNGQDGQRARLAAHYAEEELRKKLEQM